MFHFNSKSVVRLGLTLHILSPVIFSNCTLEMKVSVLLSVNYLVM